MFNFNSYLFLYWQGLNVRGGRFLISFESRNFFKKNRTKWELDVSSRSKVNPYDPKVFTNFFVFSIREETSAISSFPPRRRIRFASRINWEASVAINERQNIATSTVVSSNGTFLMSHGMTLKINLNALSPDGGNKVYASDINLQFQLLKWRLKNGDGWVSVDSLERSLKVH